ncbi:ParB/RepB/Spo0J family partition protein [Inquilinus sp. Marseille-Q2685]|uniref:ParB/RepB/Spo0J family partition protein n=1 Tax=Inquilinus sp. Marseille-Q2685 TaxID=2866581 RepID=UPI001CE48B03|nr:ParB/RepB/Spo0J family partition protein [Inquilinus sp. Marseille-Q2685]
MSAAESSSRRRPSLGRGLDALFGEADEADIAAAGEGGEPRAPRSLPIEFLSPGPFQPRRKFDETEMDRLVESIRTQGVLQPILVRPVEGKADRYHIIAGERRWRAAQKAKLHEVPVVVRPMSDRDALQIAIIENVQRQDLTALEEAEGYQRLLTEFSLTQEDVAQAVGKSRSHIANTLRLLDLPPTVLAQLQEGLLTAGHARALLGCPDPEAAAKIVISRGLNVRQTEQLAREVREAPAPTRPSARDPNIVALEQDIETRLGFKVKIDTRDNSSGTIHIQYSNLDQFSAVLKRLQGTKERW